MAARDFPRVVRLAFQPPVSFGVLLCFWKVKTVSGRLGYFPIDQILAALQISVKMNLVQILCLARHRKFIPFQSKSIEKSSLQTWSRHVLDFF